MAPGRLRPGARVDEPRRGIHRDDYRLAAEPRGELADQGGPRESSRVDRDLVRAGQQERVGILDRAYAAADGERDREPPCDALDEGDEVGAVLERRLHVEVDQLVGARVGVSGAELDRVADVAQSLETDAFDDAASRDIQAGDQARERHLLRKRAPAAPLFSGWNWTPTKEPALASATMPSEWAVAAGV